MLDLIGNHIVGFLTSWLTFVCNGVNFLSLQGIQPYHPARLAGLFSTSFTEITDEVIEVAINMMRSLSNEETTPYICYYTPVQLEYYCSETPQYQELHVQKLPTDKSSVNIHHLPGHWVTSYYNHTSGHIHVFDSLMCNSHLQDVSKQLMIMYEQNKVNNVIYERVTQQSIEPICGLMAIAVAYTCLNAKNPAHVHYDITKVRSHFQQCILDGHLSEFPSKNLHLPITQEQSPFHRTTPLEMYFNDQLRKNLEKQDKSNIHTVQDKKQRHAIWKANNRLEKKQRQTQKEIDSQKKLDKERMAAIRAQRKQNQTPAEMYKERKLHREKRAASHSQKKQNQTPEEINKEKKLHREKRAARREQKKQNQTPEEMNKERKLHREKMAASRSQKKQSQTPEEINKEKKLLKEKKATRREQKKQNQTPEEMNKERKLHREKKAASRSQKNQNQTPAEMDKEMKLHREKMAASRSQKKQNQTPEEINKEKKLPKEEKATRREQKKRNQTPEEINKENRLHREKKATRREQKKQNQTPEEINKEKKLHREKKT